MDDLNVVLHEADGIITSFISSGGSWVGSKTVFFAAGVVGHMRRDGHIDRLKTSMIPSQQILSPNAD
eukprot:9392717-Pyramimonas_sp.AAC.1